MAPVLGAAMEYLNQALSQRGSDAVPYAEHHKWHIREHLSELLKMFPTLTIRVSDFTCNDGRTVNLLKAEGTIPIYYQGHKYNIPVVIWLPDSYPTQAPLVYVTPTPNMIVKQGHSCVDPSGTVRTEYLASWLFPSSNLYELTADMCMKFGSEPPLYSKPPNYVPPPPPQPAGGHYPGHPMYQQQPYNPYQPTTYNPMHPQPAAAAGGSDLADNTFWGPAYNAHNLSNLQGPSTSYPAGASAAAAAASRRSDIDKAFKELAVKSLREQVQSAVAEFNRNAESEMERLLRTQKQLEDRDLKLQHMVRDLQEQREGCEGLVTQLAMKSQELEQWLANNEWKMAAVQGPVDASKVVVPMDAAASQQLTTQAEEAAIEDVLLALDRALRDSHLPIDVYLKQVRSLCRRQFIARALGMKISRALPVRPPPSHNHAGPSYPPPLHPPQYAMPSPYPPRQGWPQIPTQPNPLASRPVL